MAEAEFTVKGMVSEWKIEAQYFSVGPIFWTIPTPLLVRSHSSGVSIDQWNFGKLATARPTGRPEPALNEIVQPGFYCYPMFLTHGHLSLPMCECLISYTWAFIAAPCLNVQSLRRG